MTTYNQIYDVIVDFYAKATHDFMIGYHFRKIESFEEHFPRIANFWYLQLKGELYEKVDPPFDLLNRHKVLGIKKGEINRWMTLFFETLEASEINSTDKEQWKLKAVFFKERIEKFIF